MRADSLDKDLVGRLVESGYWGFTRREGEYKMCGRRYLRADQSAMRLYNQLDPVLQVRRIYSNGLLELALIEVSRLIARG